MVRNKVKKKSKSSAVCSHSNNVQSSSQNHEGETLQATTRNWKNIGKIVGYILSVVSIITSNAWSIYSTNQTRTQWLESGPQFSFVFNHMPGTLISPPKKLVDGVMVFDYTKEGTIEQKFLISNTGRLSASILSLRIQHNKNDIPSLCHYDNVTIHPGESKVVVGRFHVPDIVDGDKMMFESLSIVTADGLITRAQPLERKKSDEASIELAFKQATKATGITCKTS